MLEVPISGDCDDDDHNQDHCDNQNHIVAALSPCAGISTDYSENQDRDHGE